MIARPAAQSDLKIKSQPVSLEAKQEWTQYFLLFALFFAALMLLHAPLLRLPYFWDEAGYYVPAARDLFLTGTLIPQSTPSNAHPPLVMAWLALSWRIFGYSTLVTRTAMLAVAAFSLVGLFRLSRVAANPSVAWATVALVGVYPVYFTQSSMAHVDLPAAGLTFWGLAAYLSAYKLNPYKKEERPWKHAFWFSLAVLAKETAILAPLALFGWEVLAYFAGPHLRESERTNFFPPQQRQQNAFYLLLPVLPLAAWYTYHYLKTGFWFGNPEFFRYNVAATLSPLRIPLALLMRLWQLFGYFGLYLLTLAGLLAMFRSPQRDREAAGEAERQRIPFWMQSAFLVVLLAYLAFMSVVGGAVLARYMLPVVPLVVLAFVSTLWRRVRYWKLIVAAIGIAFAGGLFSNPPYGFSLEDDLAYRDYIVMHAEASRFLTMRYPGKRILTAWPASDELSRPWLGYVGRAFRVLRIEDFSASQITIAAMARGQFDVTLVFSTKYQPPHPLLENWDAWQRIKEKFFGHHRDLPPEVIAQRLGGTISYHEERNGQWIAVITIEREEDARNNGDGYQAPSSLSQAH
jgi:Dolichyl-phosphate-mannose-protein mannosyltransferase